MGVAIEVMEEADIPLVAAMGADMHAASSFAHTQYSEADTSGFLEAVLALDEMDTFIALSEGALVGFIICSVVKSFYGPDLQAHELAMYVAPEYRQKGVAPLLVQAYVSWAREKGAVRVSAGNSAGTEDRAYTRLFGKEGFCVAGSLMWKELN